jgi:hypothetical protein
MLISLTAQITGRDYMATWKEVTTVLINAKTHKAEMVNDSLVKTLIPTSDGRTQLVWIENVKGDAVFSSVVCKIDDVNLVALFKSDVLKTISYGLSSIGEHLVMRHAAPLENMNVNELAQPIVQLAIFGDILEAAITGQDAY